MSIARPRRRHTKWWIGGAILVLALLYFIRPGADRLRESITGELSKALGRPVTAGSVSLRFLPQPGFDLENFSVAEDPAFGAEPLLRSRAVSANLSLSTLWRRRLDISSLHLTEPSLNMVLDHGHWNTESILNRAAKAPATPTSQAPTAEKPPFPYIDATEGRINFKLGAEKKPWVLTEADFSVALTSDDAWYLKIEGRPLRTDQGLSDTGTLRGSVTLKRGSSLAESPIAGEFRWQDGQLGQMSRLFTGSDPGWRGATQLNLTFAGRAADLELAATGSLSGFHRYDIEASGAPTLSPRCSAKYSVLSGELSAGSCTMDLGGSSVRLKGAVTGLLAPTNYSLTIHAEKIPANALLAFAKVSKQNVPRDLAAEGTVDFSLSADRTLPARPVWALTSSAKGLTLHGGSLQPELTLGDVPLLQGVSVTNPPHANQPPKSHLHGAASGTSAAPDAFTLGPIKLTSPKGTVLDLSGSMDASRYALHLVGDSTVQRALQWSHAAGFAAPVTSADGNAHIDASYSGAWAGFATPVLTGTAQLHSVTAQIAGLLAPLEIESAYLTLLPGSFHLEKLSAKLAATRWSGSAERALDCGQPESCAYHFDLHSDRLAATDLQELLQPASPKKPWYRRFGSSTPPAADLAQLHAEGALTIAHLEPADPGPSRLTTLSAFTANLSIRDGKLAFSQGKLKAGSSIYTIEGSMNGNGELDAQATHGHEGHHLTGSILQPQWDAAAAAPPAKPATSSRGSASR